MRAIQLREFGGPELLELVELPRPVPAEGELLIEVSRAGLNFADTHQRHNAYVAKAELPLVPGIEVAGRRLDTGERVVAVCGTGGYAEYATAPADRTFPIPDGVSDETALALLIQGMTVWHLYATSARMQPGESVVIVSAAGGVGTLATQLGRALGAGRVIATASTEQKRALTLELGAHAAVDGDAEGLTERLLEANGGEPVDVVLELAGGAVFDACFEALAPFGRIVVHGISSREQNELRTGKLLKTSRTVAGFWFNHLWARPELPRRAIDDLFARAARGELRVVVGATYPLAQAAQAQIDLAARRTTGKLLLDPRG